MTSESRWYHGSPMELSVLRVGSTITREREIARVFSHKPSLVSISGDDDGRMWHNGTRPGFLYEVLDVEPADVRPHPTTTMAPGVEWLTHRDLPLLLIERTVPREDELLDEDEQRRLWEQHRAR